MQTRCSLLPLDEFLKAISPTTFRNLTPAVQLDQRICAVLSFLALSGAFLAVFSLLLHFGLVLDSSELMSALEANTSPEVVIGAGMAALLLTSFIVYRYYLLLLSFVRSLRAVFHRSLRRLRATTPVLRSAPRSAHGSRAPPFFA